MIQNLIAPLIFKHFKLVGVVKLTNLTLNSNISSIEEYGSFPRRIRKQKHQLTSSNYRYLRIKKISATNNKQKQNIKF